MGHVLQLSFRMIYGENSSYHCHNNDPRECHQQICADQAEDELQGPIQLIWIN